MPIDLLRTATGDLDLTGGDIHFGESTLQHQRNILLARMGDYSTSPTVGVGAADYLDSENPDDFYRAVRTQFAQDGMRVDKVGPQIVAEYVND